MARRPCANVVTKSQPLPPVKLRPGDRILSQEEAARIRGLHRETLRHMSETGVGPRRIQLTPGRFGYLACDFLVHPNSRPGRAVAGDWERIAQAIGNGRRPYSWKGWGDGRR